MDVQRQAAVQVRQGSFLPVFVASSRKVLAHGRTRGRYREEHQEVQQEVRRDRREDQKRGGFQRREREESDGGEVEEVGRVQEGCSGHPDLQASARRVAWRSSQGKVGLCRDHRHRGRDFIHRRRTAFVETTSCFVNIDTEFIIKTPRTRRSQDRNEFITTTP